MQNDSYTERIEKYLDGTLSDRETEQFKAELESSPALKKAFLQYSIHAYKPPSSQSLENRTLVETVFENYGPVPEPALPLFFRLRMLWNSTWGKWGLITAGVGLISIATWLVIRPTMPDPPPSLINGNIQYPYCPGGAALPATNVFCNGEATIPEMEQMVRRCSSNFCIAEYYLAHLYLRKKQYGPAVNAFDRCLAHYDVIGAYAPKSLDLHNALAFNRILAELGEGKKSKTEIKSELDALIPQLDGYPEMLRDAEEVSTYLNGD